MGAGLAVGLSRSSVREVVQIAGDGFPNDWERARTDSAVGSAVADDLGQAYGAARDASCANRGNRLHDIQQLCFAKTLRVFDNVTAVFASC